jgi:hypothetical protein
VDVRCRTAAGQLGAHLSRCIVQYQLVIASATILARSETRENTVRVPWRPRLARVESGDRYGMVTIAEPCRGGLRREIAWSA